MAPKKKELALTEAERSALPKTKYRNIVKQDPENKETSLFIPIYSQIFYTNLLRKLAKTKEEFTYSYDIPSEYFDAPVIEEGAFVNIDFWKDLLNFYTEESIDLTPELYEQLTFPGLLTVDDSAIIASDWIETIEVLKYELQKAVDRAGKGQIAEQKKYTEVKETEKRLGEPLPAEDLAAITRLREIVGPSETTLHSPEQVSPYDAGTDITLTVPGYDYSFSARYVPVNSPVEETGEIAPAPGDLYIIEISEVFKGLKELFSKQPDFNPDLIPEAVKTIKEQTIDNYGNYMKASQFWFDTREKDMFLDNMSSIINALFSKLSIISGMKINAEVNKFMDTKMTKDAGFNLFKDYDYTGGTWTLDKKSKTIKRKPALNVESAIKNQGAWSYDVNEEVLVDIDAFEFTPVVIEARLPGLQYQVRTSSGNTLTISEKDIVDATVDLF